MKPHLLASFNTRVPGRHLSELDAAARGPNNASMSGKSSRPETDRLSHDMSSTSALIEEAQAGRMFILVDSEDRENEGDLVIPAQFAMPEAVKLMVRNARGLVCLALTRSRVEELGLPLMSRSNGTRLQTAFTVSVEAREGITTGISAYDRARTIAVAIDPNSGLPTSFRLVMCSRSWRGTGVR